MKRNTNFSRPPVVGEGIMSRVIEVHLALSIMSLTLSTSVGFATELDTIPATTPQKMLMGKLSSKNK